MDDEKLLTDVLFYLENNDHETDKEIAVNIIRMVQFHDNAAIEEGIRRGVLLELKKRGLDA